MQSYANSYHIDLTNTLLPTRDLTLARVSVALNSYINLEEVTLPALIPNAVILSVKGTVVPYPDGTPGQEITWFDLEIYIPKTQTNRSFNGLGDIPEKLCQAVLGTGAKLALVEVINLNEDKTPIYFRREIGDLSYLPLPEDYKFVFTGVPNLDTTREGVLIYRAYSGQNWFVKSEFNTKLKFADTQYRPSTSLLFVLGLHARGFWVAGRSIAEIGELTRNPLLDKPSAAVNQIVDNFWKLNPELQDEDHYQVYHRAIHAYKLAYGEIPIPVLASILTNPDRYRGLADFLITAPNPLEPNLRTYIEANVRSDLDHYGTTAKTLTQETSGH